MHNPKMHNPIGDEFNPHQKYNEHLTNAYTVSLNAPYTQIAIPETYQKLGVYSATYVDIWTPQVRVGIAPTQIDYQPDTTGLGILQSDLTNI